MKGMSKVVTAVYDAEANVLRLLEPLEGFEDHAKVLVSFLPKSETASKSLSGALSQEGAEQLARAVEEMFPIEK